MDAAEYKHVVLGLIFLKYISDAFEELYQKLKEGKGAYEGADSTSSADGSVMQKLHTTKVERKILSDRMKDPADPMKLVIAMDMWLTGFDAPCLQLMVLVKRTLNKYGYPPDMQQKAVDTVLKQAELLAEDFVKMLEYK